jgi:hypothetical protein
MMIMAPIPILLINPTGDDPAGLFLLSGPSQNVTAHLQPDSLAV